MYPKAKHENHHLPIKRGRGTGRTHTLAERFTLTLTPTLSPGERETSFPRVGNMAALDWRRFRDSMRELFRGNLTPGRTSVWHISTSIASIPTTLNRPSGTFSRSCGRRINSRGRRITGERIPRDDLRIKPLNRGGQRVETSRVGNRRSAGFMGREQEGPTARFEDRLARSVPAGESPTGTGGSPVPPVGGGKRGQFLGFPLGISHSRNPPVHSFSRR